jgi:hypothetical protein
MHRSIIAVLGWRVRPAPGRRLLVGLNSGWQGNLGDDASCRLTPAGECVPEYPSLTSVGALAGWEAGRRRGGGGASLRAVAGPAYYHAEGAKALGLQARVDLATMPVFRVALVASARGALMPRFRGDRLTLGALGVGVRVQ